IDIRNRMKRLPESGEHARLQPDGKIDRHDLAELAIMLDDRAHAPPEKQLERLSKRQRYAKFRQLVGQAATAQQLAVDEHAVAIEDDQLGLWPDWVHRAIRSYTHSMSNSSPRNTPSTGLYLSGSMGDLPVDRRQRCGQPADVADDGVAAMPEQR